MSNSTISIEVPQDTRLRFTGRQKLVLMLHRAGYSREYIAEKMQFSHVESVSRLVARAKKAEAEMREAAVRFLEG